MKSPFKKIKLPDQPQELVKDRLLTAEQNALRHLQKYVIRRAGNLRGSVRRASIWLIVVMLLSVGISQQIRGLGQSYLVDIPAAGGIYSEGVTGKAENVNPLFASSETEQAVSGLIFGSLLKYDTANNLVGDLATGWNVDESGRIFTVVLRNDARWHDGALIQSADVKFTIERIQDPGTHSPLAASWRNVVVEAPDPQTVRFTLPAAFPPFIYSLTTRIVPKHVLAEIPPSQLRTADFNLHPYVGSGPFIFKELRTFGNHQEIRLVKNANFYDGEVKLDRFDLYAFENYDEMISAFKNRQLSAVGGLHSEDSRQISDGDKVRRVNAPLQHESLAFFKTSNPILQDSLVRHALAAATDKDALVKVLDGWFKPMNTPLLPGQLGYDASLDHGQFDLARANQLLDQAGWVRDATGMRKHDGKALELSLVASTSDEYPKAAAELQRQWQSLGIVIRTNLVKPSDLQQNIILPHNYDILLYELSIGQDPDVFAYWHSSQATDKGLNLSEYRSQRVDDALEAGRTRSNTALRAAKYHTFLEQWQADVPAVALYQPGYGYAYRKSVSGFIVRTLVDPVGRFYNAAEWTASTRRAVRTH